MSAGVPHRPAQLAEVARVNANQTSLSSLGDLGVRDRSISGRHEPDVGHSKIKFWKNLDPLLGQAFRRTHPLDRLSNIPSFSQKQRILHARQ